MAGEPGAPLDEALTLEQLAEAAGIELMAAYTYCHDFPDHLITVAPGKWAPITVAMLQIIHAQVQAGYSAAEIKRELDAATPPATEPPAPYMPSDVTERLGNLRDELRQRPPASEDTQERPWWQRWVRRS
jgi:hypothetical protein